MNELNLENASLRVTAYRFALAIARLLDNATEQDIYNLVSNGDDSDDINDIKQAYEDSIMFLETVKRERHEQR